MTVIVLPVSTANAIPMKIVSVNASSPKTISFKNEAVTTGIFKTPLEGTIEISRYGIASDTIVDKAVHGGLDQAIYLYHKEDYDWWSEQLGRPIAYGSFGENLTLAGLEDINWVIGDRLVINEVELEVTAPRTPCFKLAVRMDDSSFVKQFAQACRPGAYARVINGGALAAGDTVRIEKTQQDYATVKEVFTAWHSKDKSPAIVAKALASPIAKVHKAVIQSWSV